jgi:hypothetical protein
MAIDLGNKKAEYYLNKYYKNIEIPIYCS